MEIVQKKRGDVNIISILGSLDTMTSPEVETYMMTCINEGCHKLLINLEETTYISSSGLRVMLVVAKRLKGMGELRLSNLSKTVEEVFEISGFNLILNVHATEQEALSNFPSEKR